MDPFSRTPSMLLVLVLTLLPALSDLPCSRPDHLECFFSEISESDEMLYYIQHGKQVPCVDGDWCARGDETLQMKRNSQLFSSLNEGIFVGEGSGGKR